MAGPSWLAYTFASVMIITAAYCVSRLLISRQQHRPTDHQVDAVHVLMGVAMAGMLVPRLRVFWAGGWEIVFGAAAAWFAWQAIRGPRSQDAAGRGQRHHLQHALACAAMLYMFLAASSSRAVAAGSAMSGMAGGGAHFPTLALVLAFALLGYVVWTTDRLPSLAPVAAFAPPACRCQCSPAPPRVRSPRATPAEANYRTRTRHGQAGAGARRCRRAWRRAAR